MKIKSFKKHFTYWNLLISLILLLAFFIRIYRTEDLLGFYYDQGRDAKVIWDLWHSGKTFLIGPVTGLSGIFLGPFYYYLIAPFYLLGNGNPVYPSVFLSFLVTCGLFVLYKTGELIGDKKTGFVTLLIGSFSGQLFFASRWLSNPTPILFSSILLFYSLVKIIKEKKVNHWWYLAFLLAGVSFHFESASAAFYFPVMFIFLIWQRKKINLKTFLVSVSLLFFTFVPQLLFNFRHQNILIKNVLENLLKKDKEDDGFIVNILQRLKLFWIMYSEKIFFEKGNFTLVFSIFSLFGLFKLRNKKENIKYQKLFGLFLLIPALFYLVYRGNHGVLYDYYFTGYYLVLVLLFAWGLSWFWKNISGKFIVSAFVVLFIFINISSIKSRLTLDILDGKYIFLGNELIAVDWVFNNSFGRGEYNVDVYVPPVVPHTYDYLFLWKGQQNVAGERQVLNRTVDVLYTIYEVDPPHPERLEEWLDRQSRIGIVEEETSFGGITVQRRKRIADE